MSSASSECTQRKPDREVIVDTEDRDLSPGSRCILGESPGAVVGMPQDGISNGAFNVVNELLGDFDWGPDVVRAPEGTYELCRCSVNAVCNGSRALRDARL